ncbi:hypothetical protein SAMN04487895_101713 [Paenibacillus sophorae]|uniref:Uncharacterized protein n=1 Tax=Paenibacillus sophorae TaxID=1333845 RepID=A0A1H8H0G9_9BACL|nr:hypothetical protein SAMN04487895_101713 [Paenibacillus sophorae]
MDIRIINRDSREENKWSIKHKVIMAVSVIIWFWILIQWVG